MPYECRSDPSPAQAAKYRGTFLARACGYKMKKPGIASGLFGLCFDFGEPLKKRFDGGKPPAFFS